MPRKHDTVVAVATPCGISALGIVRLSGPAAIEIVDRLYAGSHTLAEAASLTVHRGTITDPGNRQPIDDVLVTVFRAPNSYTGEDLVEISCHGNPLLLDLVVKACIRGGTRLAQAGEFTRRALENGKLDLIQAEAVLDLVTAQGEWARQNALSQLEGRFSVKVREVADGIAECLAQIEAGLDFPEDEDWSGLATLGSRIKIVSETLGNMLAGAEAGIALREGPSVVIVGRPNVGKSSLFNCLVGQERVIVTDVPGTTRDYVEETIRLEDHFFRIVDTAGLGWAEDRIAALGMEKTAQLVDRASLLLVVFDLSEPAAKEDQTVAVKTEGKRRLLIGNKADRPKCCELAALSGSAANGQALEVSALTGDGLDQLRQAILDQFVNPQPREGFVVTRRRQIDALSRAQAALRRACVLAQHETIAVELRIALDALGELVGRLTPEDILNRIFAEFCIGK